MNAIVVGTPFTAASDVVVRVRNGTRVIAVDPDTDALVFEALRRPDLYPDVEGLFDIVERSITEADETRVTYDQEFGFPREVFSDPDRSSVDGEYEAIVLSFTLTSQPVQTLRERVAARREQWDGSGIVDYDFSLGRVAPGLGPGLAFEDVRLVVRSGIVLSRTLVETGLPLDPAFDALYQPIDAIFDAIDVAIAADAHRVAVAFDLQLRYPTDVFIDPVAEDPNDREEYFVSDLSPQVESGGRFLIIEPTQLTFTPGRPGRMRLENLSDRMIGYNLCFNHFFERQVSGRWEALLETRISSALSKSTGFHREKRKRMTCPFRQRFLAAATGLSFAALSSLTIGFCFPEPIGRRHRSKSTDLVSVVQLHPGPP